MCNEMKTTNILYVFDITNFLHILFVLMEWLCISVSLCTFFSFVRLLAIVFLVFGYIYLYDLFLRFCRIFISFLLFCMVVHFLLWWILSHTRKKNTTDALIRFYDIEMADLLFYICVPFISSCICFFYLFVHLFSTTVRNYNLFFFSLFFYRFYWHFIYYYNELLWLWVRCSVSRPYSGCFLF